MEAQPKLRDSKKKPEASTGGRASVPVPRTARRATPPGSQKGEKKPIRLSAMRKNAHKAERWRNASCAVVMENTCARRVMKDKHSTDLNTDTLHTARYLRLLKPAGLTAIPSARGETLWNWAVSSRCFSSVSHGCSVLHLYLKGKDRLKHSSCYRDTSYTILSLWHL